MNHDRGRIKEKILEKHSKDHFSIINFSINIDRMFEKFGENQLRSIKLYRYRKNGHDF